MKNTVYAKQSGTHLSQALKKHPSAPWTSSISLCLHHRPRISFNHYCGVHPCTWLIPTPSFEDELGPSIYSQLLHHLVLCCKDNQLYLKIFFLLSSCQTERGWKKIRLQRRRRRKKYYTINSGPCKKGQLLRLIATCRVVNISLPQTMANNREKRKTAQRLKFKTVIYTAVQKHSETYIKAVRDREERKSTLALLGCPPLR